VTGNPAAKKREKERKRQERAREKQIKREQRKLERGQPQTTPEGGASPEPGVDGPAPDEGAS